MRLAIDYQGAVTEELELETVASAPGLFTTDGTGAGPALAVDGAGRLVTRHGRGAPRGGLLVGGLIAVSIAVETWGLVWARVLGW